MNVRRLKLWSGTALLVGGGLGLLVFLVSPRFAEPAGRVGRTLWSGLVSERPGDLVLPVDTLEGVHVGAPIFELVTGEETTPVAHVVRIEQTEAGGPAVRLRFATGEAGVAGPGPFTLRVLPPRRGLADAVRVAMPPETAAALAGIFSERLDQLWRSELGPAVAERLPAFLGRIDPRNAGSSHDLLTGLGDEAMRRLRPLLDELLNEITRALEKRFDFLDRMGVLWKFVRGDGKGLKRKVQPVAEQAARIWWEAHQTEVLQAIGGTFDARLPEIREWVQTDLLAAAHEELLAPVLAAHRERLEAEAEALVKLAVKRVVRSERGGFRVRFAAMLRMTLLGKKRALLLLERVGPPDLPPDED